MILFMMFVAGIDQIAGAFTGLSTTPLLHAAHIHPLVPLLASPLDESDDDGPLYRSFRTVIGNISGEIGSVEDNSYEEKVAHCKSVLRGAAENTDSVELSGVLSALKTLDRLERIRWKSAGFDTGSALRRMLANLNGRWRFVLGTEDLGASGTKVEILPRSLRAIQTFDTTSSDAMIIESGLKLGTVPLLKMTGLFEFVENSRKFDADFDRISIFGLRFDLRRDNDDTPLDVEAEEDGDKSCWEPKNEGSETSDVSDNTRRLTGADEGADSVEAIPPNGEVFKASGAKNSKAKGLKHYFSWIGKAWRWGKGKIMGEPIQKEGLSGKWNLMFTASQRNIEKSSMQHIIGEIRRLGTKNRMNSSPIRMVQTLDLMALPTGIQWDVYLGDYLIARLLGSVDLSVTEQLMLDEVDLEFGAVNVLGLDIDLVNERAGTSLTWVSVDDSIAVARDKNGGLFLWKRVA